MSYDKPTFSGIPFTFTSAGYELPSFGAIPFEFGALPTHQQTADLQAAIRVFTTVDLSATINLGGGSGTFDLASFLNSVQPANLNALLHGYDFKDISASLHSWAQTDVGAIIGTHLPINLGAQLLPVLPVHLNAWLHGWATFDLGAGILPFYTLDLPAQIRSTWLYSLEATISPIPAKELQGLIHAWHTTDLGSSLIGGYGPYDLQAYLQVYPSANLNITMKGVYSTYRNLIATLEGWYTKDLSVAINMVYPYDLGAYLTAQGKAIDLSATIIPSTILLKRVIQIPLMEYKNLAAIINFACFGSNYSDLSAYIYPFYKHDLRATVVGWHGGTADNLKDLGAYINTATISTQDKITIRFIPDTDKYSRLTIRFTPVATGIFKAYDTLSIMFGNYYYKNLQASVTGILESLNLSASITPTFDYNYSELPEYIRPKTHEVFINLAQGEVQWRRFIELMFDRDGTAPFKYFYVDGTQKVYRIDRDRHWTIWATGYSQVADSMIERANIRKKFIFDLSKYSTIDAAIRELTERAAHPSWSELSAYIDGGLPPHWDLGVSITARGHKWVRNLRASITVI